MKKLFYILILIAVASTSITSCTEEVVKPKDGTLTGGGLKD